MNGRFLYNEKGFTLAEVLITLVVIGVIAALSIPAMIQNIQDAHYKTAYKKAFADVNQAFLRAKNNYEFIDNNLSSTNVVNNIRTLENYFSVTKTCTNAVDEGCWIDNCINGENDCFWTLPSSNDQGKSEGFVDSSGRQWIHYRPLGYFILLVDTNGQKAPNRMGRDRFPLFFVNENNLTNATSPIKVRPYPSINGDIITADPNCSFGNCFYTSWLKQ